MQPKKIYKGNVRVVHTARVAIVGMPELTEVVGIIAPIPGGWGTYAEKLYYARNDNFRMVKGEDILI